MNKLSNAKRAQVASALLEGNSIRSTSRMTGVSNTTILKLLADLGTACAKYADEAFRNLNCRRIQCDAICAFCDANEKNVSVELKGVVGYGDVWTWTAIDAETKLIPSWRLGWRDADRARAFMTDLASRLARPVQLTTDGHEVYLDAVGQAFGGAVDYAMLVKIYGAAPEGPSECCSPAVGVGTDREETNGDPDPKHVSTSYVERSNLTVLMGSRRFTHPTSAFSKKVENLGHALAIHFFYYNFCRIHQSLRCSPAMKAKVTGRLWEISDMVVLLD
ncbi:MAG: DDE-type integrase/transposase/recombinase [Planctomycetes bacterium]|nr:DDE-type integrase/transposase/recombinase [Planctomycetota bacterium]